MQLVLTEDQELLAKTAADWVTEKSPLKRVRALRDASDPDGFSKPLWKEMAELGWVGIPFPEEVGGAAMGLAELGVILEALGRQLAPEPFLSTVLLAGQALHLGGSDAQKAEWLPRLTAGEALLALAYQERGDRRMARGYWTMSWSSTAVVWPMETVTNTRTCRSLWRVDRPAVCGAVGTSNSNAGHRWRTCT